MGDDHSGDLRNLDVRVARVEVTLAANAVRSDDRHEQLTDGINRVLGELSAVRKEVEQVKEELAQKRARDSLEGEDISILRKEVEQVLSEKKKKVEESDDGAVRVPASTLRLAIKALPWVLAALGLGGGLVANQSGEPPARERSAAQAPLPAAPAPAVAPAPAAPAATPASVGPAGPASTP